MSIKGQTVDSLDSAHMQRRKLVEVYVRDAPSGKRAVPRIYPKTMTIERFSPPLGETIHGQI